MSTCLSYCGLLLLLSLTFLNAQNATTQATTAKPVEPVKPVKTVQPVILPASTPAPQNQSTLPPKTTAAPPPPATQKPTAVKTTQPPAAKTTQQPAPPTTALPPKTVKQTTKQATKQATTAGPITTQPQPPASTASPSTPPPQTAKPPSPPATTAKPAPKISTVAAAVSTAPSTRIPMTTDQLPTDQTPAVYLSPVVCQPVLAPVETSMLFEFYPYFVNMHRCMGSAEDKSAPNIKRCVASTSHTVRIHVERGAGTGSYVETLITNHTSCTTQCVLNASACTQFQSFNKDSCICDCNHSRAPVPSPCQSPQVWSQNQCNCVCQSAPKKCQTLKTWSPTKCDCECSADARDACQKSGQRMDPDTCICYPAAQHADDEPKVSVTILVLVMLLMLVTMLLSLMLCNQYCHKRAARVSKRVRVKGGMKVNLRMSMKRKHTDTEDDIMTTANANVTGITQIEQVEDEADQDHLEMDTVNANLLHPHQQDGQLEGDHKDDGSASPSIKTLLRLSSKTSAAAASSSNEQDTAAIIATSETDASPTAKQPNTGPAPASKRNKSSSSDVEVMWIK